VVEQKTSSIIREDDLGAIQMHQDCFVHKCDFYSIWVILNWIDEELEIDN